MSGYTPGPWVADTDENLGHVRPVEAPRNCIALVDPYDKCGDMLARIEADARLIAAAPDMLEALKSLCDFYGEFVRNGGRGMSFAEWQELTQAGRAAIQKAEGGGE